MRLIVVTTFDCDLGPRGVADGQSMQPERILPDGCERRFLREVGLGPKMLDGLRSLYRIRGIISATDIPRYLWLTFATRVLMRTRHQ